MDYKITYKDVDGVEPEPEIVRFDLDGHWRISGGEWPFIHFLGRDAEQLASYNLRYVESISPLSEVAA